MSWLAVTQLSLFSGSVPKVVALDLGNTLNTDGFEGTGIGCCFCSCPDTIDGTKTAADDNARVKINSIARLATLKKIFF